VTEGTAAPDVTVVIPTKDRPALLASCLEGVLAAGDASGRGFEVVVVDDGSEPPVEVGGDDRVRVVRTPGVGPSRARNLGIAEARAPIVAFTDDDVVVDRGWLAAALEVLDADPAVAGVTGDTTSPAFDPLYEHSVFDHDGGSFLTCNVAYRTSALHAVGGFDRQFPHAAHEDRDLAWRVQAAVGEVRFAPRMRVLHPGRSFDARQWDRRGGLVVDDWLLLRRYPDAKASGLPVRVAPAASMARRWLETARSAEVGWRTPRRAARLARLAGGQMAVAAWVTATQWRHHRDRPIEPTPGLDRPGMRIAYVGPVPSASGGGAAGVAGLLLAQLAERGMSIDCYLATSRETDALGAIASIPGVEVIEAATRFGFERWYSRQRFMKMATHQASAALARRRLAGTLSARHQAVPYDVIYQFSAIESFGVPPARRGRPPVVIHPSVHAAGELRWMRNERALSDVLEGTWRPALVRAWLRLRAWRQRRDARRADRVLALSAAFAADLVGDYGIDPARVAVVPNCIDVDRFTPSAERGSDPAVVSVGRLVVRKGLEDVVALSHELRDEAEAVEVVVVGAPSLWSDYSGLMAGLEPGVGRAVGRLDRDEVAALVARSLCLVQLSRYEPFGLTVAEALACGVPVVVTRAVGAAEGMPDEVATVVEPGDVAAIAAAVRGLLALAPDERAFLSARCRAEAIARFAPEVVADRLEAELVRASALGHGPSNVT
jgi:glycosyltransferase involved in cell wall biosynthesis